MSEPVLHVIYQDNHLIAVHKPAGLLTQGDQTGDPNLLDEVKAWLAREHHKPGRVFLGLLHRLDRPVSGLVLFAKTSKAAARMSELFRERAIDKRYHARLEGVIEPAAGRLEHHLVRQADGLSMRALNAARSDSQRATLRYRTLASDGGGCSVEIELETGRKHQIRVQFARVGHPILGDRRYGARKVFDGSAIALSAVRLAFVHPVTKQPLTLALPAELSALKLSAEAR